MIMMVTLRPNVLAHDTGVARFPILGAIQSEKWRTPLAVIHRIFEGNQLLGFSCPDEAPQARSRVPRLRLGKGTNPTGPEAVPLGIRAVRNQWYQTSPLQ
ncbi:hypothetical protein HMPREF9344_01784 [Cutibacterium acnes HL097PA1]|nr:hypothetical protein HMPREF9344_01784 [Cutibacterium acnes HL097PA1]EIA12528.1 hypothetical protein TICEST70_06466 [Cutibacterium acnes PRP-38]